MGSFRHLSLLLWKNFLLQLRTPWAIVFEIGIPCFFIAVIAAIRVLVAPENIEYGRNYSLYDVIQSPFINKSNHYVVMYSPNNSANSENISKVVGFVLKSLNDTEFDYNTYESISYDSEQSLVIDYLGNPSLRNGKTILCGIIFDSVKNLSTELKYKLRFPSMPSRTADDNDAKTWRTQLTFPEFTIPGPRENDSNYGDDPGYQEEGFLIFQHLISLAVANLISNANIPQILTLNAQIMPYPPYLKDFFILALQFLLPMIFMLSFIYPLANLTKNIVLEKERRLKEYMKMMGLKNWLHWVAWFIKSLLWLAISVIIITIILCVKLKDGVGILNKSNFVIIYIFFLLYSISTIAFGFMLSTFFSKSNVSGVGSGVLFFFTFVPYFALSNDYGNLALSEKLLGSLLSNAALGFGSTLLTMWEGNNIGVQWSNIAKTANPDDNLTFLHILMMFVIDTILYLLIAWYIEAVFPGEFGVPQKFYFPFTKSYWIGSDDSELSDANGRDNFSFEFESKIETPSKNKKLKNIEPEPQGIKAGIKIKELSKTFDGGDTYAVNKLSLNTYSGQITALLGHNGAGKTTTMSIITGLFPPSKGTVIVNGYDIRTDLSKVHDSLGICPQFDVLFDALTVEEHLLFFCKLKNFDSSQTETEITRIIEILGLEDKRKAQSRTLSGGMKRKLSVGIALVGGSKIVILDEPTSGMDVSARRFTWDLLLQEKQNRTILLSTHFMEEADVLGDRIAIMSSGELQCCGSPLFLKKKYGAGYHLTIVKKNDSIDPQPITRLIKTRVTNAKMENAAGSEIYFSLPDEESDRFESLFSELETSKVKLGIESYGISITTMEEVFLKVGEYAEEGIKAINENQNHYNGNNNVNNHHNSYSPSSMYGMGVDSTIYRNTGLKLMGQQFHALLMKKILFSWRNTTLTLTQLFVPFLLMVFSLWMIQSIPKPQDSPNLTLNLNNFKETQTYVFFKNNTGLTKSFIDNYETLFDNTNHELKLIPRNIPLNNQSISYLFQLGIDQLSELNLRTPISVIVDDNDGSNNLNITALYNNQAFHTPAITVAYVDYAILKYATNNSAYSFEVSNHPFPRTVDEERKQNQDNQQLQSQISQQIIFAMSFLIASFSILLVRERAIKSKHLQQVCGVKLYLFWLSSFIWDFLIYIIPCFLIMLVFLMFKTEGYNSAEQEMRVLLILVVHGIAVIPWVYAVSFLFEVPSSAYVRICLFSVIIGSASFISVMITEIPSLNILNVSKALDWIFNFILPNYCLSRAFFNLYNNYLTHKMYDAIKDIVPPSLLPEKPLDYLNWNSPGIGKQLVLLLVQAVIYWIIVLLIEYNVFRNVKYYFTNKKGNRSDYSNGFEEIDDDVRLEKKRLETTDLLELTKTDALVIKNLTKFYGDFCAVDNISYGVKKGECFGLLGVNGAGKTTTFKMITGDEPISSGDIYVDGYNVKNSIRTVQRNIGYCPQFDGLLDQMTGRETLTMFCRLRGIKNSDIPHEIDDISKLLYFDMHLDKIVGKYSGGTKRKLSTAVALLGDPPVSFLDEPTTGVDPVARRCLWDALTKKLSLGSSIVLTSHSMEECEALCSRLIIMVNGKICCIGSSQQLKNKFGKGYTVLVKVSTGNVPRRLSRTISQSPTQETAPTNWMQRQNSVVSNNTVLAQNINELKSFMSTSFPGCELKGVHNNLLHYSISDESLSWSKLFGVIERAKDRLKIEDYSIGQTTLEQIFLAFARQQRESGE